MRPKNIARLRAPSLALSMLLSIGASSEEGAVDTSPAQKILLLGNSILYVGNVPATLSNLSRRSGVPLDVGMYAQPGAKVSDIVNDDHAMELLRSGHFDAVVFHDQGGNSACASEPELSDECVKIVGDHRKITEAIKKTGATPYLLGTYQKSTEASERIEAAESRIASDLDIVHIPVSGKWHEGMKALPDSAWLAADGMHPGDALTALMAIEILVATTGRCPSQGATDSEAAQAVPLEQRERKLYVANAHRDAPSAKISAEEMRKLTAIAKPSCTAGDG